MSSLFGTLSIATGALEAEQGAMNATTNNVANANTPGYCRQQPILAENDAIQVGLLSYDTGVSLAKLQSVRDPILQMRIQEEIRQQGQLNAFVTAMQQTQTQFTTSSSDIGTEISNFFSSLNLLSTNPTSLALRQGVLTAARDMTLALNNTANNLQQQRSSLDRSVVQDVQQVNVLTGQIATLNHQISHLQGTQQDASALMDQRDVLIGQLSGLINVSSFSSDNSLTLTTSNGTPLVVGGQSFALSTQTNVSGMQDIYSQGKDVTADLTSGALGGLLQARDQAIPGLQSNLDALAAGLSNSLNAANTGGYDQNGNPFGGFDLNGNPGGNLFVPPPASGQGAAAAMTVAITDPNLIAASSDPNAPGSSGNMAALSGVQNANVVDGQTPTNFYSNLVFSVGNDVSNTSSELSASLSILNQLQDQRAAISGVSLNEEAANLVQFQNAFDAAAHVVTIINDLLHTVINMGTLTA